MQRVEVYEVEMSKQLQGPTQLVWSESDRQSRESQMDTETSVNLRCHLAEDFTRARSWDDLINRLQEKGFHLRFDLDRLVVVNDHTGVCLCTCRYLGFGFDKLTRILGKPCVHAESRKVLSSDFSA